MRRSRAACRAGTRGGFIVGVGAAVLWSYEAGPLYRRGASADARREHERLQAILDGAMHGD